MLIQDLTERMNPNVTFKYKESSEGDKNRGWTVDKVVAYLNGEEVGYLKMSYIPRECFERYYPGILNYLTLIGGHHVLPYDNQTTPWREIPADELRKCIYNLAQTARMGWTESNNLQTQANNSTDKEVYDMVAAFEKKLTQEKGLLFKRFKSYFVDKPIVDYIKVEDKYKRQGIGTALYRAGYEWMRKKGMTLYASGIQSDDAKATWKTMQKQFHVKKTRTGHPFSPMKRQTRRYFASEVAPSTGVEPA